MAKRTHDNDDASQDSQEVSVADEVRENAYDYSDPEDNDYDFEDGFLVDDTAATPVELANTEEEGIVLLTAEALFAADRAGRPQRLRRLPVRYTPSASGSLLSSDDGTALTESTVFGSPDSEDQSYTSLSSGDDSVCDVSSGDDSVCDGSSGDSNSSPPSDPDSDVGSPPRKKSRSCTGVSPRDSAEIPIPCAHTTPPPTKPRESPRSC
jgi:hypothetical protein